MGTKRSGLLLWAFFFLAIHVVHSKFGPPRLFEDTVFTPNGYNQFGSLIYQDTLYAVFQNPNTDVILARYDSNGKVVGNMSLPVSCGNPGRCGIAVVDTKLRFLLFLCFVFPSSKHYYV